MPLGANEDLVVFEEEWALLDSSQKHPHRDAVLGMFNKLACVGTNGKTRARKASTQILGEVKERVCVRGCERTGGGQSGEIFTKTPHLTNIFPGTKAELMKMAGCNVSRPGQR